MTDNFEDMNFNEKVYAIVKKVPMGKVIAYGQIAKIMDMPRSARGVGRAMYFCPDDAPWQRVVMANGTIAGGDHAKIRKGMLESEGVTFLPNGRVDMKRHAVYEVE